jgi:hypothetical protein
MTCSRNDTQGKVVEVGLMLMRTDPFRDLDRFTQQVLGTAAGGDADGRLARR